MKPFLQETMVTHVVDSMLYYFYTLYITFTFLHITFYIFTFNLYIIILYDPISYCSQKNISICISTRVSIKYGKI